MQNAKDTFYDVLRGRLAALNPERTIVLRGLTRPAALVTENELVSEFDLPDCFRLQWMQPGIDPRGAMPTVTQQCEVLYETAGTPLNSGMDRGRLLAAMDGELLAAVIAAPQNALKMNFAGLANGAPPVAMATRVWWGAPVFGPTEIKGDRLVRKAQIAVISYQEAGEL